MQEIIRKIDANQSVDVEPINRHDFKYIYNPSFRCQRQDGVYPLLVILVKSADGNFQKRKIIRYSWGNVTEFNNTVQVVYLLGNSKKYKEKVDEEYTSFADIISQDFVDAYMNNTYKTMMGFNWAVKYCSKSKFFLFVDDDFFIRVKNVMQYLRNISAQDVNLFTGHVIWKGLVDRSGKWAVSKTFYPSKIYPPYLVGGAYITSYPVARIFSTVFPYIKYLGIDDVYLGIVAYKVNIKPTSNKNILKQGDKNCWKKIDDIFACHRNCLKIPTKKT